MNKKIADIIGIGIGPFNLGLAALLLEHRTIQAKFLERKHEFQWHLINCPKALFINLSCKPVIKASSQPITKP